MIRVISVVRVKSDDIVKKVKAAIALIPKDEYLKEHELMQAAKITPYQLNEYKDELSDYYITVQDFDRKKRYWSNKNMINKMREIIS